jgi:hypothetical protein
MNARKRGRQAQSADSTMHNALKIRCDQTEKDFIDAEADIFGISTSEFVRHCALHCAMYLKRFRETREKQHEKATGDLHGDIGG